MNYDEALQYCLTKPGSRTDEPWPDDLVVKVGDKVFAFLGSPERGTVGLKCGKDADSAQSWRSQYPDDVTVSSYIGRYGWNSFRLAGAVPDDELYEAIDASYADVVGRLPKSKRPSG